MSQQSVSSRAAARSLSLASHLRDRAGVRVGIALWGGLVVVDLARATGVGATATVVALAVLAAAGSVHVSAAPSLAVAATTWAVSNGFVSHTGGQLGLTGPLDLLEAAALVVLALGVSGATR